MVQQLYPFFQQLFIKYLQLRIVLSTMETMVSKTRKISTLKSLHFQSVETGNQNK